MYEADSILEFSDTREDIIKEIKGELRDMMGATDRLFKAEV